MNILFAVLASSLITAGCATSTESGASGGMPEVAPMHRETIDRLLQSSREGDFVYQVLEDYWVTDEELQEGMDRFHECVDALGMEGFFEINGSTVGVGMSDADRTKLLANVSDEDKMQEESDGHDRVAECGESTGAITVAMVHGAIRSNPEGLSRNDAVRRCLAESGHEELANATDDEIEKLGAGAHTDSSLTSCLVNPTYGGTNEE